VARFLQRIGAPKTLKRSSMRTADAFSKSGEIPRRLGSQEVTKDVYEGVDLAPRTLESLVTWDVSGHARREQDRMSSAYRAGEKTRGTY
jgi:hypothetical protein